MDEKIDELEMQAESGNVDAMLNLARELYRMEKYEEARKWYRMAAKLGYKDGDPIEMFMIGRAFYDKQDYEMAKLWFEKAARLGHTGAMLYLGFLYNNVEHNYQEAKKWFEKAAELGDSDAMFNLGFLYYRGNGAVLDFQIAKKWFEKAAELGNTDAILYLGLLYLNGNGVEEDKLKAKEWLEKAAELGDKSATLLLEKMKDEEEPQSIIESYEKAAASGDSDAMCKLGEKYYYGKDVEQDDLKAKAWFEKAAELGNARAMNFLGLIYEFGRGVKKDYQKAIECFEKAAELGDKRATLLLEKMKDEDDKSIKNEEVSAISNVNDGVKKLKNIVEDLSGKFIARGETVRMLANNIYHGRRVIETFEDGRTIRKNITTPLIISSTGGGKTAIVSDLAKKFELPYVSVSLSGFTQAGYKGLDLQNIFIDLIKKANGKVEAAEKGIVILDEFDKIRIDDDDSHRGFNMELQDELLSYLEGREVYLETKPGSTIKFDTSRVTFILCGAFQEITGSYANYSLEEMKTRISYGYKSELFARIGTVHYMPKYTKSDYFNILNNSSISPLKNFVLTCSIYGKSVITSPYSPFIESVAEEAVVLDQGVRGLENIFSNIRDWYLEDLIYGNSDIYLMASYEEIKKDKGKGRRR